MPPKSAKNSPRRPAVRARTSRRSHSGKIQPSEDFFDKAFRLSPHPIGITELETGRCLEINDTCLEIFGFRRDEVIGQTTLLLGIWPDPQERAKLVARLQSEGSIRNVEVSMRIKNGTLRHVLISTDLIMLKGKQCLLTIGNDITERKQAEDALCQLNETLEQRVAERTAALHETEGRFRTFLNNASNLAFMKTCDGRYLYVNRRFEEVFQTEQNNILGKTDADLFPREQADQFQTHDRCVLEAGKAMVFEEMALYADGLHTNIAVKFPVRDGSGQVYAMGGIVTDITERKKAERTLRQNQKKLRGQQAQLQELTAKLLTAQEQERKRIARDLHDDVTQRLASLAVDAGSLERLCKSKPALLPHCRSVREAAERLADDVHSFAYRLHPSSLEHLGLDAAIRDHTQEFAQRAAIVVRYVSRNVPKAIPIDMATCLYRVAQESLQNVLKHADASMVMVRLLGSSNGVGVCIHDDGKGFEEKEASGRGLGLLSMGERVRLAEGTFRIRTRPGDGTEVHAWVPLPDVRQELAP